MLLNTISRNNNALIIVDCDADGYTSAALFINYLYRIFPTWTENHLKWIMHSSKQHGLSDCMDKISNNYSLVICPDSSSNDYKYHH